MQVEEARHAYRHHERHKNAEEEDSQEEKGQGPEFEDTFGLWEHTPCSDG